MKAYFELQYKRSKRKIYEISKPFNCYLMAFFAVVVFVGLSIYLFYHIPFAAYFYATVPIFFALKLCDIKRNEFLKNCFGNKQFRKIRAVENLIIAAPFLVFLIFKQQFIPIFFLIIATVLIAFFNFKTTFNFTIPTPFYKKPYEFIIGFRYTFPLIFIVYTLTVIAVTVGNFNLGIISFLLIFIIIFLYYWSPENEYFVWSHSLTPQKFLIEKIKTAYLFSFYLYAPILFLLSFFYFESYDVLLFGIFLLIIFWGYLYLTTIILAKYSVFPKEIHLMKEIILAICFVFPPLLILVIPLFAKQSIKKLKGFLNDKHT